MQEKLDALVRTQAMQLFRQQGLHFTMQQVAEPLHISKKTIYTVYPSKEALLLDMVDHAFAEIHHCKQKILAGSGTLQEKLRAVIIAMPTEYAALDLRQMKELDEKYPVVAARVRSQLENGWEPTMALLEQAVAEGVMRPVSLPVLRQMITASIESFLADRSLAESGVQYVAVAKYAKSKGTNCEVSLENMMACGIGACLCCVENTTEGHLCVCKEGPVFNINKLLWQV